MGRLNLIGEQFERLLVIGEAGKDKRGKLVWLCRCICGVEKVVLGNSLKTGATRSCGCLKLEQRTTHGQTGTLSYTSYLKAKERCENSNTSCYAYYGGRGIKFLFNSYEEFIACIGPRPGKEYSLDRINNDGHYQPGNIRWATRHSQSRNRRSTRLLTYQDESLCVTDWAKRLGFRHCTITKRLASGWSVEKALSTPIRGSL